MLLDDFPMAAGILTLCFIVDGRGACPEHDCCFPASNVMLASQTVGLPRISCASPRPG